MAENCFEMEDGSCPEVTPLDAAEGKKFPLAAFAILAGGDVFETVNGKPPPEGPARARAYVQARVAIEAHGAAAALVDRVTQDIAQQISCNLRLIERLQAARPIHLDLIPPGAPMSEYGYPGAVSQTAQGLFWVQPEWDRARIALRQERLGENPYLVFHEMAHAIQGLAFTQAECDLVYRALLRTYGNRAAVDEVFAIYSEREFVKNVTERDLRAPGVYGMARKRWDENHVFTRFVRNLYFPHKPLAGPKLGGGGMPSLF